MQMVGFDQANAAMDKLGVSTDKLVASQTKGGTATDSLGKKLSSQKTSLVGLSASFGTIVASSWSLYNAWDSLEVAQLRSDRANTKVKGSMIAVQTAQTKLNDAITKYGAGSSEAQLAADKLSKAQEQLANNSQAAEIAAGDLTEANAQFVTQLPFMVTGIIGAAASFIELSKNMGGMKAVIPALISSVTALGSALRFLALNPIGIAITVVATAFVLLATNAFGVTDALRDLGKTLGDILPFFKGLLTAIGATGDFIFGLVNPAQEASTALDATGTSAEGMGTSLEGTVAQVEGLGGALVDQDQVITDVIAQHRNLVTQQNENQQAYEAWKLAITTGNTDLVESYNLTADDIAKFEDQYEKEMDDSAKAAEEAAKKAYEAWKKSVDDSRKAVEGGFGVLESTFNKIMSDVASALDEGGKEFKKVLDKVRARPR